MCVGCKHNNVVNFTTNLVGDEDTITVSNGTTSLSRSSLIEDAWGQITPRFDFNEMGDSLKTVSFDITNTDDKFKLIINEKGELVTKAQLLKLIEDSKWSRKMGFSE